MSAAVGRYARGALTGCRGGSIGNGALLARAWQIGFVERCRAGLAIVHPGFIDVERRLEAIDAKAIAQASAKTAAWQGFAAAIDGIRRPEHFPTLILIKASEANGWKGYRTPRREQRGCSMKARDIMTRNVVTVSPDTPVRDIAALMAEKHISGVPVLTHDGIIIGIVSETDLLHREELGTAPERKRKWWLDFNALAREYAKAYGLRAEVVMSRCVVAVRDDADLRDVADVLDRHRFKRVPVLQAGQLVGIITRGDLVRALSQAQVGEDAKRTSDAALHKMLRSRIRTQPWMNDSYVTVAVHDGVVDLGGFVETADQHNALSALVEGTEGVRGVDDKVVVGGPFRRKGAFKAALHR